MILICADKIRIFQPFVYNPNKIVLAAQTEITLLANRYQSVDELFQLSPSSEETQRSASFMYSLYFGCFYILCGFLHPTHI